MKKVLSLALVLIFALSFAACGKTYPIAGKWKTDVTVLGVDTEGENYVLLEFNEDGTGRITTVSLDVGDVKPFSYSVEGNKMTVTSDSGKVVQCEYEIKGDTLKITSDYKSAEYTRVTGQFIKDKPEHFKNAQALLV